MIGTATSDQATRNHGDEANIDNSRTIASLMWHLDHGQLRLDNRTLLVLDEAEMTKDPDMLRLAWPISDAGAKPVVVGDDRQLRTVGPGGALGTLDGTAPGALEYELLNSRRATQRYNDAIIQLRQALAALDSRAAETLGSLANSDHRRSGQSA